MNQLHLKYKMDNGIQAYSTIGTYDGPMEVPSEEYLEWVEDLALKQIRSRKDSSELPALKVKLQSIERDFDQLACLIGDLEEDDLDWPDIVRIKEACDELSLNF